MKNVNYILALFAMGMLLAACSESSPQDTYLGVSPTTLTFSADGGTQTFQITSNSSWTITIPEDCNFKLSAKSGTGDQDIQITVPKKVIIQEEQTRLMIRTAEGKVENLTVRQEGMLLTGGTLMVTNAVNNIYFSGTQNDIDSLQILSNIPWKIYGPEWIQAWNGSRWVDLSPTRATVEGGAFVKEGELTHVLSLRTKSANDQEASVKDNIKLTPSYDNTAAPVEFEVVQLGKHHAVPNKVMSLAQDLAWDFKCGTAVEKVYYCLSEKDLTAESIPWSESDVVSRDVIVGFNGLKENTPYYIYTLGAGENNSATDYYKIYYQTRTSKNQPIAEIQNVSYSDTEGWKWSTAMNSYCTMYSLWGSLNEGYFDYTDGMLAWIFNHLMHDDSYNGDDYNYLNIYNADNDFSWATNYHIQIITWGVPSSSNIPGGVIDRYRSIDHYQARSHFKADQPQTPRSMACSKEELKKAFIRIK